MEISFYFPLRGLEGVDLKNAERGNPGLGGTEFQMLLVMQMLSRRGYNIVAFAYENYDFGDGVVTEVIEDFKDICQSSNQFSFLVMKNDTSYYLRSIIEKSNFRVIIWGHNFYFSDYCSWLTKTKQVVANVFVGKQQYDRYLDNDVLNKSYVINNMLNDDIVIDEDINKKEEVVFMGALVPQKGFYQMLEIWKIVSDKRPNAILKVIGTGKVHSREAVLGKLGIAEESFEKQLSPLLLDEKGEVKSSIKLLGLLGEEKYDVFANATVGVINPSARTEIFSISIMEMAISGLPVVTLNKNGFPDSIVNGKTGYLCNSIEDIASMVCKLLDNIELSKELGKNAKQYFNETCAPDTIMEQWEVLFERLKDDRVCEKLTWSKPITNNFKYLRIINAKLRKIFPFLPSIIALETFVKKNIVK